MGKTRQKNLELKSEKVELTVVGDIAQSSKKYRQAAEKSIDNN